MNIQQLSNDELQHLIQQEKDLLLLDVRTPEEYHFLGHIPGAQLLPTYELPNTWKSLDKEQMTVVICEHGVRSMEASLYLANLGFLRLYNLTHGRQPGPGFASLLQPPLMRIVPFEPSL